MSVDYDAIQVDVNPATKEIEVTLGPDSGSSRVGSGNWTPPDDEGGSDDNNGGGGGGGDGSGGGGGVICPENPECQGADCNAADSVPLTSLVFGKYDHGDEPSSYSTLISDEQGQIVNADGTKSGMLICQQSYPHDPKPLSSERFSIYPSDSCEKRHTAIYRAPIYFRSPVDTEDGSVSIFTPIVEEAAFLVAGCTFGGVLTRRDEKIVATGSPYNVMVGSFKATQDGAFITGTGSNYGWGENISWDMDQRVIRVNQRDGTGGGNALVDLPVPASVFGTGKSFWVGFKTTYEFEDRTADALEITGFEGPVLASRRTTKWWVNGFFVGEVETHAKSGYRPDIPEWQFDLYFNDTSIANAIKSSSNTGGATPGDPVRTVFYPPADDYNRCIAAAYGPGSATMSFPGMWELLRTDEDYSGPSYCPDA